MFFPDGFNQFGLRSLQRRKVRVEAGQLGGHSHALLADAGDLSVERASGH